MGYYYVGADSNKGSGICCDQCPKEHPVHLYRESVFMGETPLSAQQIMEVLCDRLDAWPSLEYHPISKNCITFSEELLVLLRVPEPFPAWVRGISMAVKAPLIYPIADWCWHGLKWSHQKELTTRPPGSHDSTCKSSSAQPFDSVAAADHPGDGGDVDSIYALDDEV